MAETVKILMEAILAKKDLSGHDDEIFDGDISLNVLGSDLRDLFDAEILEGGDGSLTARTEFEDLDQFSRDMSSQK